jgi:hypothetical protein
MAMIRCPDCGRNVSGLAASCPHCGRPFREGTTTVFPGRGAYPYEYRSQRKFLGLPLVHIIYGPSWLTGFRPACGIIAVGNIAVGVVAFGGVALGLLAFGGIALGLLALGGLAIGLGLGAGGVAIGYWALGGVAIGAYAIGGLAIGAHTLQNDPEFLRMMRELIGWQ